MLPVTRTPEGEPLRCKVCGAASMIEVSRPPNDSVCPVCGALAWMDLPMKLNPKEVIQAFVSELKTIINSRSSRPVVARCLVKGLAHSLAAHGVALWSVEKRHWWSSNLTVDADAIVGEDTSMEFAIEVARQGREIVRSDRLEDRECLRIGIPIVRKNRVVAVIDVAQRSQASPEVIQGYMRFTREIARELERYFSDPSGIVVDSLEFA